MRNRRPSLQHPPPTNRGVQNTTPLPFLEPLIDWFAFTVPNHEALEEVMKIINIPLKDFVQMPKGALGYKSQLRHGHIAVLSDGKPEMGIHVEMSGQGCRQFDVSSGRWRDLIKIINSVDGHFTRIDVAIDDRKGLFKLSDIEEKMQRREVRTRFKEGRDTTSFKFSDEPGKEGKTLYFGSVTSDAKIRIYDKAIEQGVEGVWIRTEVECRRKRANMLAKFLCEHENLGEVIAGVLKNYVLFVEPSADSNKARWEVSTWWAEFLGSVQKLKLSIKKVERTIEQVQEWFGKQAAPSLALLFRFSGGDFDFLVDLIRDGDKRLRPRHLAMLC